jgi:hypothetical protein
MQEPRLTQDEKASLSTLAKQLFDRGIRAQSDVSTEKNQQTEYDDTFSPSSLVRRVGELEEQIAGIARRWSASLNQVLFTVEHLEKHNATLAGEVLALRHSIEQQHQMALVAKADLEEAARIFAESTATKVEAALDRVEALLDERLPMHSRLENPPIRGNERRAPNGISSE